MPERLLLRALHATDAADLAERTGLRLPDRADRSRWSTRSWPASPLSGLAVENLQARVRGVILMALSNQDGHLVLTTGNKSELAVGYSTLYGDSVGGFDPLKDVPKTLVWRLARWRNADAAGARRDAADPGELDQQAAERRAAPGPARHRLAARLRGAGRDPGRLRRQRPGPRRADRGRARPGAGRPGAADGRHRRVQAPAVPARPEDLHQGVRPGPPAAHHQPVARATLPTAR